MDRQWAPRAGAHADQAGHTIRTCKSEETAPGWVANQSYLERQLDWIRPRMPRVRARARWRKASNTPRACAGRESPCSAGGKRMYQWFGGEEAWRITSSPVTCARRCLGEGGRDERAAPPPQDQQRLVVVGGAGGGKGNRCCPSTYPGGPASSNPSLSVTCGPGHTCQKPWPTWSGLVHAGDDERVVPAPRAGARSHRWRRGPGRRWRTLGLKDFWRNAIPVFCWRSDVTCSRI
jgi:hypothetical protein